MAGKDDPTKGPAGTTDDLNEQLEGLDLPPDRVDSPSDSPAQVHEIDPDSLVDDTQESLAEAAQDLDTRISNLPPKQRLMALLGFSKNAEARYLPVEFKAVKVVVPRHRLADVERVFGEYALPINTGFLGNPKDETITLNYVVPNNLPVSNNYLNIVDRLEREKVEFSISIAQNQPIVIRTKGHELNILGANFATEELHRVTDDEQSPADYFIDKPYDVNPDDLSSTLPEPLDPETNYSTQNACESAKEDKIRIPRQGECLYLMIEDNFVDKIGRKKGKKDEEYLAHFLNQLSSIYNSPDFTISRQNGYILIIGTAERAGSYLTSLAKSIFIASSGEAKALVGSGTISHSKDGKNFDMSGNLPTKRESSSEGEEVFELESGIYLNEEIYDPERLRLKGRDGSQNHTVAQAVKEGGKWLRLKEHRPSVELAVGGPDKFIGYEDELYMLDSALNDDTTRLTVLKAAAGMGKSRLLSEVARNNPSMVVLSLDPSGKNIQGSGLVTVAEQLMQYVGINVDGNDIQSEQIRKELGAFRKLTQAQKIKMAQTNPRELVGICSRSMDFLRKKLGKLKVVLDDVHHVDKHSDAYVMGLMSSLVNGDNQDKVVLSMRPEERYSSSVQKTFEAQIGNMGKGTVRNINLNGLDFSNEKIAYDFIYHSLPEDFRKGKTLGGDWWKRLGKQAGKFPLAMMTFMNAVMAEHERLTAEEKPSVLTAPENKIMLSESFLEHIATSIPAGDLGRYYKENINKLPENLKTFMQTIALLGGTVSPIQLYQVQGVTGEIPVSEINEILIRGRYLIPTEDGKYRVQHQTIVDSIVGSIEYKQKVDLSTKLYLAFKKDRAIGADTKLALLHNIAPEARYEDAGFWKEYGAKVGDDLERARKAKSYGKSYGTALTVLGLPPRLIDELEDSERTVVQEVLGVLEGKRPKREVDHVKIWLTISALESFAEGAMMIGKFTEAEETYERLDKILDGKAGGAEVHKRILPNLFQVYYLKKDSAKMEELYDGKIKSLFAGPENVGIRAFMELQIAYLNAFTRGGDISEGVQSLTALHDEKMGDISSLRGPGKDATSLSASAEIARLVYCRVPFEEIRDEVVKVRLKPDKKRIYDSRKGRMSAVERKEWLEENDNKKLDEDVIFHRGVLDENQRRKLIEIDGGIKDLDKQQKAKPELFSPHAEMSLLDIKAQVAAMMGRHQEAVDGLSEYWRQADQMEIHSEAARAAKMKGDIQMVQAFSRHNIDRGRVLEAIRTYSEEGIKSLTTVDPKSFYNVSVRVNRIRAVGALAMSYAYEMETREPRPEEKAQMRAEFLPHLETALKDFDYLNQKRPGGAKSGEMQYYLMGYMGHVLKFAKENRMELPDLKDSSKYPYPSDQGLKKARKYAEGIDDDPKVDLKEKERKLAGIEAMKDFVGLEISL